MRIIPVCAGLALTVIGCDSRKKVHCAALKPPKSDCIVHGARDESSSWLAQYDFRTRNPKWAYEYLTRNSKNGATSDVSRNHSKFFAEPTIELDDFKVRFSRFYWHQLHLPILFENDVIHQVRPNDFKNTGYDRGHLVPAADFARRQDMMDSTFTMSNISPQVLLISQKIIKLFYSLSITASKSKQRLLGKARSLVTLSSCLSIRGDSLTIHIYQY